MKKTLFMILALTLIVLVATGIVHYILKPGKRKRSSQEQPKQKQKPALYDEEPNPLQSKTLTNLSHELRTPLALMIGQLESIIQTESFTPMIYTKLLSVYENSLQINGRISELLDTRQQLEEETISRLPAGNRSAREIFNKVVAIVDKHIDNPDFSVDQLASEAGIARTNLYIRIKAVTGQTPNKFILTTRLKKAAFLLRNHPDLRISEISDVTGFTSAGYFGKCFKEYFNTTPMSYRAEKGEVNRQEDE